MYTSTDGPDTYNRFILTIDYSKKFHHKVVANNRTHGNVCG